MDLTITSNADKNDFNIQVMSWEQVRKHFKQVDPHLVKIIDNLNPGKQFSLIKARYPYGVNIIDNGILHLPHKSGKSISIEEADIPNNIKNMLLYSPIPLSLPINKACEVFLRRDERIDSLKMISPGSFFGLFEVTALMCRISVDPVWSVSSGARSLFMLPKIADQIGYSRIKKELNISINSPRTLYEHFDIFKLINNHPSTINNWYCDVIFFSDSWFNQSESDANWLAFYNYLFKQATIQRMQSPHNSNNMAFDMTWQNFIYAMGVRNLRPRPYILDTVKYLVGVAAGIRPAFRPADNNEMVAPTKRIQEVYTEIYGLKNYLPTIFHQHLLIPNEDIDHVYYSLAYPLLQEGLPSTKINLEIISDIREIKLLFDTFINAIETGKVILPKSYNLLDKVRYVFFHNGKDIFNELKSAKDMVLDDITLIKDKEHFPNREFCTTSPFLSGCLRVSSRNVESE